MGVFAEDMVRSVDCVLLAAGSSERMGRPKLLMSLGPTTIFETSLANHAASSVRSVLAVVPGWVAEFAEMAARLETERVRFLFVERPCEISESLRAGWEWVCANRAPDGIMISLADKPLLTAQTIDGVVGAYAAGGCDACVPTYRGSWGHPVILDSSLGGEILNLHGDRGARAVLEAHRDRLREVPVASDEIVFDVDEEPHLAELRARLASRGPVANG